MGVAAHSRLREQYRCRAVDWSEMSAWAEIMRMFVLRLLAALLLSAHSLFASSNRGHELVFVCCGCRGAEDFARVGI
jgi:hypothetical protein